MNKNIYYISYQNNLFKDRYIDGIEIGIKNDKVISLKDIYSFKLIDLVYKSNIMTIDQLFNLIKRRLNDNSKNKLRVFYDIQYGYPYYIKNENEKIEIFLHSLKII